MIKTITKISIILALLLYGVAVYARTESYLKTDDEELPVNVQANYMNYDRNKDILTAKGDIEITQGNRTLKADTIWINLITNDTKAQGNVVLYEGDDILYCDSFNINFDTQLGEVQSARIFIKQQNFHIEGQEVKRVGLNNYQIKSGRITTCDGENPLWRIEAKEIDVTVEGYARAKNSTFKIKGFPIAYLPYTIFPVKIKRQTGFLFPEIGHSKKKGFQNSTPFFWAISENTDATLWLDTASQMGFGTGLEYRFKLQENTWGKIYGYYGYERNKYLEHEYRDQRDRDQDRGYFNIEGEHYFTEDSYVKAQGSYITDRELYGDYRKEVKRSKGELSKLSIKSREKDESLAFFNNNWDFYNLLVNVDLYKNLMHRDPDTLQRLPQVVFSGMKRPLGETSLFYQFYSSYDFFWREEGQKGHRIDIFPKISWPLNYGGWLKFIPEIGMHGIYYYDLKHDKGLEEEGIFPSVQADFSTSFIKIFNLDKKYIKKIKHAIEPGFLYEYVPSNDQRDFPGFDMPERFFKRHSIMYYVKNRFSGLLLDDIGELKEYEIGYFLLGQSFNISKPKGGLYLKGDPDEDFSDIFGEIRIGIFPTLYFKTKATYNPYDNNLRYYNALVNWSNPKGNYLEFEYRYARNRYEIFDLEGKIRLTSSLYAFFDAQYDSLEDQDLDTEIGMDYAAQCWGTRISAESSGGTSGRVSDTSINLYFYLKGLEGNLK